MISKRELLRGSLLCVILDRDILSESAARRTAQGALRSGAGMIQLRDKRSSTKEAIRAASALRKLTKRYGAALVINDRIDVACASGSDGVHIGRSDMSVRAARKLIGSDKIIGASAASLAEAGRAKASGADYIGVGPVFRTPIKASKPPCGVDLLRKVRDLRIPVIAIGGIDMRNIKALADSGFRKIAVIRAVCCSKDPRRAAGRLKGSITL
ncbi:MAG: thiamine phosphate synthase [Candidatus Omnitrophota bacterium]